jgi:hypothetical protein
MPFHGNKGKKMGQSVSVTFFCQSQPINQSKIFFISSSHFFVVHAQASKVEKSSCEVRDSNAVAIQPT